MKRFVQQLRMSISQHVLLVMLLLATSSLRAQDWHFSQFQGNPLALNPGMAGLFSGDLRLGLQYRNQWNFAANYHTISAAADAPLVRFKNEDFFAGSLQIISDQAGDLRFRTTSLSAGLAFHKRLDPYKNHYLSAGYQAGYSLRAVDYSEIIAFDPEPAAVLENDQFGFLDMAAGINWFLAPKRNQFVYAGLGMHHLNQPDQSFQQNGSAPLAMRVNVYAGGSFPISKDVFLQPALVYYDQGPHQELNAGLNLRWWLNEEQSIYQKERAIGMGVWYRAADALIVSTRFDYGDFLIGLSYDINFSKLSQVSNLNGGPEVSFVYILNSGRDAGGTLRQQMYCPSFF